MCPSIIATPTEIEIFDSRIAPYNIYWKNIPVNRLHGFFINHFSRRYSASDFDKISKFLSRIYILARKNSIKKINDLVNDFNKDIPVEKFDVSEIKFCGREKSLIFCDGNIIYTGELNLLGSNIEIVEFGYSFMANVIHDKVILIDKTRTFQTCLN